MREPKTSPANNATTAIEATTSTMRKRKKRLPSRRNSRHGSAIAARFRTMQSMKIKRPRAVIQSQRMRNAKKTVTRAAMRTKKNTPAWSILKDRNWNVDGCAFEVFQPRKLQGLILPPPLLNQPLRKAAKAITSHFVMSNGRNKIDLVSSIAWLKGARISILRAGPFINAFQSFFRTQQAKHFVTQLLSSM